MIRRFYVNNFRCLENFELPISGRSSMVLIGKNGSGKTTALFALEVLQKIGQGVNRVGSLVSRKDFFRGLSDAPVRFELQVELDGKIFEYALAFELPEGWQEMRVFEESLRVDGRPVFTRERSQVDLPASGTEEKEARFRIDWHLVALPIVHERSEQDPLQIFKKWLGTILILRPAPSLISGETTEQRAQPNPRVTNFGDWYSALTVGRLRASSRIDEYLKQVMPDLSDIENVPAGPDSGRLVVHFSSKSANLAVPFADLSDGEKCFMICALVLAENASRPLVCFWDEPDNYLALDEIGHFVLALRAAFRSRGQFIATSHNEEAIRSFSRENTLLLYRKSHLEPTTVRPLADVPYEGDLIHALIRGDLVPGA